METIALTYRELAERLGIKPESARKTAQRRRWHRTTANDGTTRIHVPVEALGRPGDGLLAISTSGNAANVCRAVEAAKTAGLWTVALCGGKGGELAALADEVLCIACSGVTARIQEGHIMIIHALCELIEEALAE